MVFFPFPMPYHKQARVTILSLASPFPRPQKTVGIHLPFSNSLPFHPMSSGVDPIRFSPSLSYFFPTATIKADASYLVPTRRRPKSCSTSSSNSPVIPNMNQSFSVLAITGRGPGFEKRPSSFFRERPRRRPPPCHAAFSFLFGRFCR